MPVVIRLSRVGTNKKPYFRLVAASKEKSRDGRFLEVLGTYNPKLKGKPFTVKKERVDYWLKQGAIPSELVGQLLKREVGVA